MSLWNDGCYMYEQDEEEDVEDSEDTSGEDTVDNEVPLEPEIEDMREFAGRLYDKMETAVVAVSSTLKVVSDLMELFQSHDKFKRGAKPMSEGRTALVKLQNDMDRIIKGLSDML